MVHPKTRHRLFRDAALGLLNSETLTRREAGFLAHITVDEQISWKQWFVLNELLKHYGHQTLDEYE